MAATRHLAAARARHALRALRGRTVFQCWYLSAVQGFSRIKQIENFAGPVMRLQFALAFAFRPSDVFALQDRSLLAFLVRLPACHAPQASTCAASGLIFASGDCPVGSFSTGSASSAACTPCSVGYFNSLVGQLACQPCPAGKYKLVSWTFNCQRRLLLGFLLPKQCLNVHLQSVFSG